MGDLVGVEWPPAVDLRTKRLAIRPTQARDRAGYIELLASADVRRYLGGCSRTEARAAESPLAERRWPGSNDVIVAVTSLLRRGCHGHVAADGVRPGWGTAGRAGDAGPPRRLAAAKGA